MTLQERIEPLLPDGTKLRRRINCGKAVWAAVCGRDVIGIHRYTLTDGTIVWNWWPTLQDCLRDLQERVR